MMCTSRSDREGQSDARDGGNEMRASGSRAVLLFVQSYQLHGQPDLLDRNTCWNFIDMKKPQLSWLAP